MYLDITYVFANYYMIMDMVSVVSKSSSGKWSTNSFIA